MLKNKEFIRENPVKIGAYWKSWQTKKLNSDEVFMQDILLGISTYKTNFFKKIFRKVFSI